MPTNLQNAQAFFNTYWTNTPSLGNITTMMATIFSSSSPNTLPTLGIAAGNENPIGPPNKWQGPQLGPQFIGVNDVTACFNKIIKSFPNATFKTFTNPVYLQDTGLTQVAVPAILDTGTHQDPWFQLGSKGYSKPLSDIEPDKNQQSVVPACAIFTFDNSNLITNLAIFMDRWQMAVDLWPNQPHGKNKVARPFPLP